MRIRIRIICTVLALIFILATPVSAVEITIGYAGINTYDKCIHSNRVGVTYCQKMVSGLAVNFPYAMLSIRSARTNNSVTRSALISENSNYYTLFVYAGHGKVIGDHNAWHVNYYNGYSHLTYGETSSYFNFSTADAKFKHNYVIAYTCNFLTNGGSTTKAENILKTMNGNRLICGFASVMYLHSDEATEFAYVSTFQSVRSAFINAAWTYQPYREKGETSIIRVVGHWDSYYERVYEGKGQQVAYNNSSQKWNYGILQTEYATGR